MRLTNNHKYIKSKIANSLIYKNTLISTSSINAICLNYDNDIILVFNNDNLQVYNKNKIIFSSSTITNKVTNYKLHNNTIIIYYDNNKSYTFDFMQTPITKDIYINSNNQIMYKDLLLSSDYRKYEVLDYEKNIILVQLHPGYLNIFNNADLVYNTRKDITHTNKYIIDNNIITFIGYKLIIQYDYVHNISHKIYENNSFNVNSNKKLLALKGEYIKSTSINNITIITYYNNTVSIYIDGIIDNTFYNTFKYELNNTILKVFNTNGNVIEYNINTKTRATFYPKTNSITNTIILGNYKLEIYSNNDVKYSLVDRSNFHSIKPNTFKDYQNHFTNSDKVIIECKTQENNKVLYILKENILLNTLNCTKYEMTNDTIEYNLNDIKKSYKFDTNKIFKYITSKENKYKIVERSPVVKDILYNNTVISTINHKTIVRYFDDYAVIYYNSSLKVYNGTKLELTVTTNAFDISNDRLFYELDKLTIKAFDKKGIKTFFSQALGNYKYIKEPLEDIIIYDTKVIILPTILDKKILDNDTIFIKTNTNTYVFYKGIAKVDIFDTNTIVIKENTKVRVIEGNKTTIYDFEKNEQSIIFSPNDSKQYNSLVKKDYTLHSTLSDKIHIHKKNDKLGIYNLITQKYITEIIYDDIQFSGHENIYKLIKNDKFVFFNIFSGMILSEEYYNDPKSIFKYNFAFVKKSKHDKYHLINYLCIRISYNTFDEIYGNGGFFNKVTAIVKNNTTGVYSVIDINGEYLVLYQNKIYTIFENPHTILLYGKDEEHILTLNKIPKELNRTNTTVAKIKTSTPKYSKVELLSIVDEILC